MLQVRLFGMQLLATHTEGKRQSHLFAGTDSAPEEAANLDKDEL